MGINLGLGEDELRVARRREFPVMLRNHVADGAVRIEVTLNADTAIMLAEDMEFAIEHRTIDWRPKL